MSSANWKLDRASVIYGAPYAHRDGGPLDDVLIIGCRRPGGRCNIGIALEEGARNATRSTSTEAVVRSASAGTRPRVPEPQRDPLHQRRQGVPGEHRRRWSPDPVAAEFAGAGQRALQIQLTLPSSPRRRCGRHRDHLTDDGMFAVPGTPRGRRQPSRRSGGSSVRHDPASTSSGSQHHHGDGQEDAADDPVCEMRGTTRSTSCRSRRRATPLLLGRTTSAIYLWALGGEHPGDLAAPRRRAGRSGRCAYADLFSVGAACSSETGNVNVQEPIQRRLEALDRRMVLGGAAGDRAGRRGDDPKTPDPTASDRVMIAASARVGLVVDPSGYWVCPSSDSPRPLCSRSYPVSTCQYVRVFVAATADGRPR